MKRFTIYTSLLLVLLGGSYFTYLSLDAETSESVGKSADLDRIRLEQSVKTATGTVAVSFEGVNTIDYKLKLPRGYAIVKINNLGTRLALEKKRNQLGTIFFSYEGGRGFTAGDYYQEFLQGATIATTTSNVILADSGGLILEGEKKEYHVLPVKNGEWIVVVDFPKNIKEEAINVLKTLRIK